MILVREPMIPTMKFIREEMMIRLIITAIITYLATSIDEMPVLFMLYTKGGNKGKGKTITITYFIGTFLLVALGLLGAFGLVQIPLKWVIGLIGLIPLGMGLKVLIIGDDDEEKAMETAKNQKSLWAQVLVITLALGADDLGVYIPLFTTLTGGKILLMIFVFAFGVVIMCLISYRLTQIDQLKKFIEKQDRYFTGLVFIAIGILVIIKCGTVPGIRALLS